MSVNALELHTERLTIKLLNDEFASKVLQYYNINKKHLSKYEPNRNKDFYTKEYWKNILTNNVKLFVNGQKISLWIFNKNDIRHDRIIGSINFNNIVRGVFQSCHLGYSLDASEEGKGYMTEALREATRYMFEEQKLHRIQAAYIPTNKSSEKVLHNLGFIKEGYSENYLKIAGKWQDHVITALLNRDIEE